MKKLLLALFTASIMSTPAYADLKVGYINTSYLFQNHPQNEVLKEQFKKKFKKEQDVLFTKEDAINALKKEVNSGNLKPAALQEKTQQLAIAKEEYATMLSELRKKVEEEQKKESEILLKEIQRTVEIYSQVNGFNLVYDSGFIVYADKDLDITEEILKKIRLNNSTAKK